MIEWDDREYNHRFGTGSRFKYAVQGDHHTGWELWIVVKDDLTASWVKLDTHKTTLRAKKAAEAHDLREASRL